MVPNKLINYQLCYCLRVCSLTGYKDHAFPKSITNYYNVLATIRGGQLCNEVDGYLALFAVWDRQWF
jgi:hypothetical protein